MDGEDERRVAVGVLRVDIDPRKREQLAGLALATCENREVHADHSCFAANITAPNLITCN